eukprot:jgi/Chrpa1/7155/Chrysochromulina_OHIO_Genome00013632-RA
MLLLSLLLGCLAAYQQPVVFSSRRAAAASIACVASPPIKTSAAASSIIERLSLLPATRSRPVNTEGLGRIVRSADTLRGSVLLQVLLHLKEERKWELAIALAALVEASFQEVNPLALVEASVKERTIDDVDEDDDEAMDAEFRRMVASSPNYVGSVVDEDEDEAVAEEEAEEEAAMLVEDPIIDGEGDAPHPMAALLRKGPSVEAAAAAATRMMTPLKGSAPDAPPVETTHYNVLIATCAAARRWQEALDLLQRMQQRGVPRDTVTYNSVLSALGRGGRWRLALATFKQMRAERVPPNTVTFASAIAACAQAGEWERALKLLDTCFATGTPRNTIVYSSAISACEKAGEWRPALDLIARMEGDGIAPDATALNAAMAACSRAARPKEAEALLQDAFERHDVERTAYSYNSLLTALARSLPKEKREGAVAGAQGDATAPAAPPVMPAPEVRAPEEVVPTMRAVLARMAAEGVEADRYSYNPLISALSRTGDASGAVAALREMQKLGIRCDGASYTSAITACEGEWPTALELLAEFQAADGLADEPLPYSRALTALQRAGEWQRACELLRDVSERGLAHNPMMTNMVLTACAEAAEKAQAAAAPDVRPPAEAGLIAIRGVLEATRRAQMAARGPNAIGAPRRPPADRATVELTRRLLLLAPPLGRDTGDGAVLLEEIERKVLPAGDVASTFYKYDKKKLLGAGAYAKVFKATLQAPRKHGTAEDYAKVLNEDGTFRYEELYKSAVMGQGVEYALKVIDTSKCADMDDITREVSILHMLTHPNIMRLYEVFYEVRTVVLVTELVAGGELFDRIIEKGNYSEKDAAKVMSQLCNALSYMH